LAAEWGKIEKLQKLWEWSKGTLTTDEIIDKVLLVTDNKGRNV